MTGAGRQNGSGGKERLTAVDAEESGTMRETDAEIPKDGDGRAPGKWENGEKSRQDAETRNGIYAG